MGERRTACKCSCQTNWTVVSSEKHWWCFSWNIQGEGPQGEGCQKSRWQLQLCNQSPTFSLNVLRSHASNTWKSHKEARLQLHGHAHHLDFYDLLPVETSDAYEIDSINNWHWGSKSLQKLKFELILLFKLCSSHSIYRIHLLIIIEEYNGLVSAQHQTTILLTMICEEKSCHKQWFTNHNA